MRVVLETNVLVRATKNASGPAREILRLLSVAPHVVVTSSFILTELERVLQYPRIAALHRLTPEECCVFVALVREISQHVEMAVVPDVKPVSADPDDDPPTCRPPRHPLVPPTRASFGSPGPSQSCDRPIAEWLWWLCESGTVVDCY